MLKFQLAPEIVHSIFVLCTFHVSSGSNFTCCFRYALDVNIERAEDVLNHKRLLELAEDPENRPAFSVRSVHVSYFLLHNIHSHTGSKFS